MVDCSRFFSTSRIGGKGSVSCVHLLYIDTLSAMVGTLSGIAR